MDKDFIQAQNKAAFEVAQRIAFQDEPGLVVVVRKNDGGRYDVHAILGGRLPLDQLRDAIMGAVIALGKVAEQAGQMGPVLTPER